MTDLPPPPRPRQNRRIRAEAVWDQARDLYLAGHTAETVCTRLDLGLSAFWARARDGGWRREDVAAAAPFDRSDPYDPDAPAPDRDTLIADAWKRAAHAQRLGCSTEAMRWMRVHAAMVEASRAEARETDRQRGEEMRSLDRTCRSLERETLATLREVQADRQARNEARNATRNTARTLSRARDSLDRLGDEANKVQSKNPPAPLNRADRRRAERAARRSGDAATLSP